MTLVPSAYGQLTPIKPPPIPDFKTPVDYTAWYFDEFAPKNDDDALPIYEPILFGPEANALKLDPKGDALRQMLEVLENPKEWRVSEKPALANWIKKLEPKYFKPFMDAASKKNMSVRRLENFKFLCDRPISRFVNGRAIGQMMFARGWRIDGNVIKTEYLIDATRSNLAFADHLSRLPSLEEQFFSSGHRNVIYTQVLTALRSFMHRNHVWDEIMTGFDEYDSVPVTQLFARSLYFAEASALQQLQHFCMDGNAQGDSGKPKINQQTVDQFYGAMSRKSTRVDPTCKTLASADPVELANAIHNYYEQMRQLLCRPYVIDLKNEIAKIENEYWEGKAGMECLVPKIGFAVQTSFRTETLRRGARVFLEKAMEFKRTGVWPRDPEFLNKPALAICRIDPYTGKDFLFRPGGDGELVYSVGVDGVDDKSDAKKDIVVWSVVYTENHPTIPQDPKDNPTNPGEKDSETPDSKPTESSDATGKQNESSTVGQSNEKPSGANNP